MGDISWRPSWNSDPGGRKREREKERGGKDVEPIKNNMMTSEVVVSRGVDC